MPKPSTRPTWATDANFSSGPQSGQPTKVDPGGNAAQGFVPGEAFHTGFANHTLNSVCDEWLVWVDATAADDLDDIGRAVFGDGSDGNVTINSGTTTLTRDMYYNDLTVSGTGLLIPDGYRVFVRGTLTVTGAGTIRAIGGAGAAGGAAGTGGGGTAGAAASSAGVLGAGASGGAGGATGNGAAGSDVTNSLGGAGGAGGSTSIPATGGAAGSVTAPASGTGGVRHLEARLGRVESTTSFVILNGGASGGGGASGSGSPQAVGGGGGAGGGVVSISARVIDLSGVVFGTTTGGIRADGGAGGAGGANVGPHGAGGGGGGGGGVLLLCYRRLIGTAFSVEGGAGGAGGVGGTTTGQAGAAGSAGTVVHFRT